MIKTFEDEVMFLFSIVWSFSPTYTTISILLIIFAFLVLRCNGWKHFSSGLTVCLIKHEMYLWSPMNYQLLEHVVLLYKSSTYKWFNIVIQVCTTLVSTQQDAVRHRLKRWKLSSIFEMNRHFSMKIFMKNRK